MKGFGLIFALWGAGLGAAAQYGKVSVTFDLFDEAYPDAGAALGWIVSLVGFVGIVFGIVAGLLVARIRYRRALLAALWLGAAVSALQALMPALPWLLALRGIEGLSHLAIVVAAPTLIAQLAPPAQRGFALTLWGTFFGVAFAILAWVGRPLAIAWGLPALLIAHATYMAAFALFLSARLRALPSEGDSPPVSLVSLIRDHGTIYRSATIAAPAAGWLFYTFCFVSVLTVLPPFIDEDWRAPVMGLMPLVSIVASMTFGVWLLRVIAAVRVVQIGFAGCAVTMLWLWAVPGLPVACLVFAVFMGLIQGASFAAVPQLNSTPATQAQANGAMAQMGNLGNTLGTPVMAAALIGFGYLALPLLVGLACLSGLWVHLWLAARRRADAEQPQDRYDMAG